MILPGTIARLANAYGWGETRQWRVVGDQTLQNWFEKDVATGSPKMTVRLTTIKMSVIIFTDSSGCSAVG
jgi:hypothetical protein